MTVSNQIIEVLDALCSKFGLAIDWSSENIIPYATTLMGKLVSYEIWSSVAHIAFVFVLLIADIIFLKKTWAKNCDNIDYAAPTGMVSSVIVIFTVLVTIAQTMDIIKCVTFPEMFVYQYLKEIIAAAH